MAGKAGGKKQAIADSVAQVVGAGKVVAVETVDFADPKRPKTCLEVDFPILPVNQVATIEGNAGKPIYQMSKWWARRRSSVFRSLLLAASMKAPDDPMQAAKAVWDVYYANHQKKGALKHLKVADIFMGGGTTVVEGARLGLQMFGIDLNPVAWFVVKTELAKTKLADTQRLLDMIEAEVKPQIMPFYAWECPRGHRGEWRRLPDNKLMGVDFDPLRLAPEERATYRYFGPEIIYVFWVKHGPCQSRACQHRTPIMSSNVISIKTLTVNAWLDNVCRECGKIFDVEQADVRMAPGVPLVVSSAEKPFATISGDHVECPNCASKSSLPSGRPSKKSISLTLIAHPDWVAGSPGINSEGDAYGGRSMDSPSKNSDWLTVRASSARALEVRGSLPPNVQCPNSGKVVEIGDKGGTVNGRGRFTCAACGLNQSWTEAFAASGDTAPVSPYVVQGYCPTCDKAGLPYGGRFFHSVNDISSFDAAAKEWARRSESDLSDYWPRSEIPFGHETHQRQPLMQQGYSHFWKMFNARQLLVHSLLLRGISTFGADVDWAARESVLAVFQQYLRNQCMFSFWNPQRDTPEPHFSNNNFHPKSVSMENCVFADLGRGNWRSCSESLAETAQWLDDPWDLVSSASLGGSEKNPALTAKAVKVHCGDPVLSTANLDCGSSTEISQIASATIDLVITDPPFGDNIQYSELSDFFYVWLRLVLKDKYPEYFTSPFTPKVLEVVTNKARHPDNPDDFYKRLLTECWREAGRILKPGGIMAFTFHHSEDEPWIAVLESLFEAGFYLEATYPIRSDETKGEGEFGSKKIEYDIVHVCRKRLEEPKPVSWAKLRREVLQDVQQLKSILQHHVKAGLPAADLQVIKRGKALEYYSRHYGKVFFDELRTTSVRQALLGINQLLDEDLGKIQEPPPVTAEPDTRLFLRIFDGCAEQPRDQMQKFLKGTGVTPDEFLQRGWCIQEKKVYQLVPPLELAKSWHGRHRKGLTSDYDQAMFLIGACFDGSGINATDTLNNENLRPHPAIKDVIEWQMRRGSNPEIQNAATRALAVYKVWENSKTDHDEQRTLF